MWVEGGGGGAISMYLFKKKNMDAYISKYRIIYIYVYIDLVY